MLKLVNSTLIVLLLIELPSFFIYPEFPSPSFLSNSLFLSLNRIGRYTISACKIFSFLPNPSTTKLSFNLISTQKILHTHVNSWPAPKIRSVKFLFPKIYGPAKSSIFCQFLEQLTVLPFDCL